MKKMRLVALALATSLVTSVSAFAAPIVASFGITPKTATVTWSPSTSAPSTITFTNTSSYAGANLSSVGGTPTNFTPVTPISAYNTTQILQNSFSITGIGGSYGKTLSLPGADFLSVTQDGVTVVFAPTSVDLNPYNGVTYGAVYKGVARTLNNVLSPANANVTLSFTSTGYSLTFKTTGAATSVIPEPTALGMLAMPAIGLLRRRRD